MDFHFVRAVSERRDNGNFDLMGSIGESDYIDSLVSGFHGRESRGGKESKGQY
jgi:hypothetical protein